jgi:hypothetical protein
MSYELEIKKEGDFIYVLAEGERTRNTLSAMVKDILDACRQHQTGKLVIDIRRLRGRIHFFDSLSVLFEEFPMLKKAGVFTQAAVVDSEIRRVRFTFIERIATRKGYNMRFFSDPDEAIKWISKDA